jgi:hypothetical protein
MLNYSFTCGGAVMAGVWFFAIFWSACTLLFDGVMLRTIYQHWRSQSFVPTTGVVIYSQVKHSSGKGRSSTPEIHFTYNVNGTLYTGIEYRLGAVGTPEHQSARQIVNAHPVGTSASVYYDPSNPATACMQPGFDGEEFFTAMFLTPFNAIMLGIWATGWAALRDKLDGSDTAGLEIAAAHPNLRVRLPSFPSLAVGIAAAAGLAFVMTFVLAFAFGGAPGVGSMVAIVVAIYTAGAMVGLWWRRRVNSGDYDLVFDKSGRYIRLPIGDGRKKQIEIHPDQIADIVLIEPRSEKNTGYAATIRMNDGTDHRISSFILEGRATRFALWLKKRLPHLDKRRKTTGVTRDEA